MDHLKEALGHLETAMPLLEQAWEASGDNAAQAIALSYVMELADIVRSDIKNMLDVAEEGANG